mgnify:CR=1 FL=1
MDPKLFVGLFQKSKLWLFAQSSSITQDDKRKAASPLSELEPKKTNLNLCGDDVSDLDASNLSVGSSDESEKVDVKGDESDENDDGAK